MGDPWQEIKDTADGNFLKLPQDVQFGTNPPVREVKHFIGGRPFACLNVGVAAGAPNPCPYCISGDKPDVKFVFDVLANSAEKKLSLSAKAARGLFALREQMGPVAFGAAIVRCTSTGSGFQVAYQFVAIGVATDPGDGIPF